ncbi:transcriptional regulator [Streptomyces sp. SCUT-3]|nr:transcriptional regulator [Streptomyces sp. DJ]QMV24960.1 transcriptional regulator [Streptomyces sp. SCUT-3]
MAANRQKLSRRKAGTVPDRYTQLAIADLTGVSRSDVLDLGWPGWLALAVPTHPPASRRSTPTAPTVSGRAGGSVERRRFLITAAAGSMASALAPPPAARAATGRRVGDSLAALHEQRLTVLRHLDDRIGSGHVYNAAVQEFDMITDTLRTASCSDATGRRLLAAAADAQRAAGWTAYDSGHSERAEDHFADAAEDALAAGDPEVLANTLAFWAIKCYSTGDPRAAVSLVEAASTYATATGSARMSAMLHARACRAHARAGDPRASDRAANAALDAYRNAIPLDEDLPSLYWVNIGEIHQLLGSSALNLGDPARALHHFQQAGTAAAEAYNGDAFPRGAAIYCARQAEAYLALRDLDHAVGAAQQAVERLGGVTSARGSATLADLRSKLVEHRAVPEVRQFLELTA